MYTIEKINSHDDNKWNNFILAHKNASIYHHSSWKSLIETTFGYESFYYILKNNKNEIVAVAPFFLVKSKLTGKRFVSLPFSDFSDILACNNQAVKITFEAVIKSLENHNVSTILLKVKKEIDNFDKDKFCIDYQNKNHILELSLPPDKLFNKFLKTDIKRNIKKFNRVA
ncbi:MAG TPA: hypothetical protein ENN22_03115 [bacterium]|nr:hypothetical protein [bacterium]